jgi:hypothetical protein
VHLPDADLVRPLPIMVTVLAAKLKNAVRTSVVLQEHVHARIEVLASATNVSTAWAIRHTLLRLLQERGDRTELPLRLPASMKVPV